MHDIADNESTYAPELDHLVVAAATLKVGAAWVLDIFGVPATLGGKHVRMGTHNLLLRLDAGRYLEVIAVDPDAPTPMRPRWFGLDDTAMRSRIESCPQLIHWVCRCRGIDALAARVPALGAAYPMERGDLRWRITIPDDGNLPHDGVVPTLIEWDVATHPSVRLPETGLHLDALAATHPQPESASKALRRLGVLSLLTLARAPASAGLRATFTDARGRRVVV